MSEQTEQTGAASKAPSNPWPFIVFASVLVAAVVALVALGQQDGVVVGALMVLITGIGAQVVQTALHRVETRQVKELANGNLSAERDRADRIATEAAAERQLIREELGRTREELAKANELSVRLAGLLAPNTAVPVLTASNRGDAGHTENR